MQFNDKQTPQPHHSGQLKTREPGDIKQPGKPGTQNQPATDDNEEDPVLTEGYLPEIYFTLKSENPADW